MEYLGEPIGFVKIKGEKLVLWKNTIKKQEEEILKFKLTSTKNYHALANGQLEGFHKSKGGFIHAVSTMPGYKRQGLSKLMQTIIYNKAIDRGYQKLHLKPNYDTRSDRFYEKMGFKPMLQNKYMIKNVGKEKLKLPVIGPLKKRKLKTKKRWKI